MIRSNSQSMGIYYYTINMNSNYHHQQLQPQSGKYSTQLDLSHLQLLGQNDLNSQRQLYSEYQFGVEMGSRLGQPDAEGLQSTRISSQMKITLNTALRQPRSLVGSRRNSRSRDLRGQALVKNNGDESSDNQHPPSSAMLSQASTSEQTASQASNRAKIGSQQSKPSSRRSSNAYLNEQINGGAAPTPISQVSLNNQVFSMHPALQSQLPSITPLDSSRKSAGGGLHSQRTALGGHLQGGMMTAPLLPANLASKKMPQDFFRDYHQQTRVNAVKLENVRMKRQALLEQSQIIPSQQDQSMMMMLDHQHSDNVSFNESLNLSYLQDQPKSFVRKKVARILHPNILPLHIPYQDPPCTPQSVQKPLNSGELNSARPTYSNAVSISQSQVETQHGDDSMMIYRTIDEKPPQILGSSYKVGHIRQFASSNVRSSSIDRRAGAVQSQNTSLADFSSLSLSKVPDLNQSIALGENLGLSKQLFSPERESSKYVMKPISIKAKSQPNTSESSGMMMQTANFPNGPVQEPAMMLSPGFSKQFSQSGCVDLSMMKEANENQKENTPKNMNVSEQVQRLISHRRSNSQGSDATAFIRRKGSKNKQTRGLAQKIVLPKNSSFLSISGIGSQTGAQIVMDGYKGVPLQTSDQQNCGGGRDQLPQCIINFNISFGNFPKLENYQHFKSSTQVMNSPIYEDLEALKDLNTTQKKPQAPPPLGSHNLSPRNLGLPFGSLAQNPLAPESPLIIESAFKNLVSTEKKFGTSLELIEPPHFLPQDFHQHLNQQQTTTDDQLSREQREHLQKLNDKDLEEIRRTLKTPCFNSTINAGSAHKVVLGESLGGDRRVLRPKVTFPKMII